MIQQTSFQSYLDLVNSGGLSGKQATVYRTIAELGEACNLDLSRKLGWPINQVTPRTRELVLMGKVEQAGKDINKFTNKTVIYWRCK